MFLNPFDLTAGPFLTLYAAAISVVWLISYLLRSSIGPKIGSPQRLGPLELAYLSGGPARVVEAATVGLLTAKAAVLSANGDTISAGPGASQCPSELQPFATRLLSGPLKRHDFRKIVATGTQTLTTKLAEQGLVPGGEHLARYRQTILALFSILLTLGVGKVIVGLGRGKPVGFLIFMIVFTIVLGLVFSTAPLSTAAGKAELARMRSQHARAARAPLEAELMLAVALTGAVVLSGTPYAAVRMRSDGGGGCGSGCGGGDGGGGGGCGGCGGGD